MSTFRLLLLLSAVRSLICFLCLLRLLLPTVANPTPNPIAEAPSTLPELPAAPVAPVHVLPEAPTHTVEMTEEERAELAAL